MKNLLTTLLFCCTLATLPALAKDNYLIKPGKAVGDIGSKTTKAQLRNIFGAANVKDATLTRAEGEQVPGTIIYANDSKRRIELTWTKKAVVQDVQIRGTTSLWHTAEGITLGTSLAQLEKLNGKPFKFSGFGWDGGDQILNWENGKLAVPLQGIWSALDMSRSPLPSEADQRALSGDRELNSSDVLKRKLNIYVCLITVKLNPEY
jgi:hypothetical protein